MTPTQELTYDGIARNGHVNYLEHSIAQNAHAKAMLFNFAYARLIIMRQECRSARSPNRS